MTFWSQLGNWGPVFNLKILGLSDAIAGCRDQKFGRDPGIQRRRNGGGTCQRNVETTGGAEYLFAPAIFSLIFACCSLNFHCLSLCCLHTIKTSHSVGTTGRILQNKLTKHIASENFENRDYSHKMFAPAMLKSFRRLCRNCNP